MSVPFLQAIDLSCERDDRLLFHHLDISIVPGSLTRVEGPNGAGKTSLLRILAGLSTGYEGSLLWQGEPMADCRDHLACNLLYIGHRNGIKLALTPFENLKLQALPRQAFAAGHIESALTAVGLRAFAHVPCQNLSAGQQRRVALARLYLSEEPVWILDEIFTGIDRDGVAAFEELIQARVAAGGAIVMTTHHPLSNPGVTSITLGKAMSASDRDQMNRPESIYL